VFQQRPDDVPDDVWYALQERADEVVAAVVVTPLEVGYRPESGAFRMTWGGGWICGLVLPDASLAASAFE
jgi:hypothetical protein